MSKTSFGFSVSTNNYSDKPSFSTRTAHIPVKSPVKVYTNNVGSRVPSLQFEVAEWDLAECGRIYDTESIFRRACRTKEDLFLKEGYEFNGPNLDRSTYLDKRFDQIETSTQKPIPLLIAETISSLIRCNNAFWVKVRDYKKSGGKTRYIGKKEIKPIAGYFILPAESVQIKRDENGKIVEYRQEVYGKNHKDFKPEDIIHWYFDKRPGFSVGTPEIVPVKADIRALRRIEENVEMLVYQHLFPLFHYKVGTEDKPAGITPDGEDEVIQMQKLVAEMPSDGCWVTPERHEIKAVQAGSSPIAAEKVMDHFKSRIYVGLGVSPIDMGENASGASRSVAQTLSRNLINAIKARQKDFGAQFYHNVIRELLLESTFSPDTLFNKENKVFLRFREIDQETRIAKDNHLVDMFLKNVITHDEFRIESGRQPFDGEGWPTSTSKKEMFIRGDKDFGKTSYGLIERDKIILQSLDEPGTPISKEESQSRTKAASNKSANDNSVSNKNQPQNQYGKRSSPKLNKDFQDSFYLKEHLSDIDSILKQTAPLSASYKQIKKELVNRVRERGVESKIIKTNIELTFSEASKRLISLSKQAFRTSLRQSGHDTWSIDLARADAKIQQHIEKYTNKLSNDIIKTIDKNTTKEILLKNEDALFVSMVFDGLEHRASLIDNSELIRAYNYGRLIGFQLSNVDKVTSIYKGSSHNEICKKAALQVFNSNDIIYEELPPHRPLCTCQLVKVEE